MRTESNCFVNDYTLLQTWRRTVEGASRVFMEKHYNRHKRLINDIV